LKRNLSLPTFSLFQTLKMKRNFNSLKNEKCFVATLLIFRRYKTAHGLFLFFVEFSLFSINILDSILFLFMTLNLSG